MASPPLQPNDPVQISHEKINPTLPKTPPGEKVSTTTTKPHPQEGETRRVGQGEFEPEQHFYPRVLNAQIHPLIQSFFTLGNERIIARYTHLNPQVQPKDLKDILSYSPTHFQWAGKNKNKKLYILLH